MVEEVGLALADEFVVVGVGVGDEEQPASAAKPAAEARPIAMAARAWQNNSRSRTHVLPTVLSWGIRRLPSKCVANS